MPIQYAGIIEEHRAVRSAAGLFDLSHMGELVVEGPEAGAGLAAALVTDPPALAVGRAHYSMICAPDGGILDDLIVYRLAEDRFMVVANASQRADRVRRARGAARRVQRRARRPEPGHRPGRDPGPALGRDPPAAGRHRPGRRSATTASPRARWPGIPAQVARTGYTGEDGFELFVDVDRAGEAWDAVLAAGRDRGLVPGGPRRPRHAPARGRDAALRQRARPRDQRRSRRASAGSSSSSKPGDFTGPRRAREGAPPTARAAVARRPRRHGPRASPATATPCSTRTGRPAS